MFLTDDFESVFSEVLYILKALCILCEENLKKIHTVHSDKIIHLKVFCSRYCLTQSFYNYILLKLLK